MTISIANAKNIYSRSTRQLDYGTCRANIRTTPARSEPSAGAFQLTGRLSNRDIELGSETWRLVRVRTYTRPGLGPGQPARSLQETSQY